KVDPLKMYTPDEGVQLVKQTATAKFDETVELHIRTGLDPRHADQLVRGSAVLPAGTGRTQTVVAFAQGDAAREAETAGADNVGALVDAVVRAKPSGAKGQYIRSLNLASTMGPGVSLDLQSALALASSEA